MRKPVVGHWASGPGRIRLALGRTSPVPSSYQKGQKRLVCLGRSCVSDGGWRGTRVVMVEPSAAKK